MKEQSTLANVESFTRILETLADAELNLRDTASKKILLEVTLLKAIEARSAIGLDAVLKQLNQLRGGQSTASVSPATPSAAPRPAASATPAQVPRVETPPAAQIQTVPVSADLSSLWTQLVEAVGRASPFVRSYLLEANPISFEKNILVIGFDPEFADHLGLVDNARNHTLLQTKLAELGHANCQIKFVKAEAPVGQAVKPTIAPIISAVSAPTATKPVSTAPAKEKSASIPFNKETFKNDPLIQKALEIFKGQIVEVRA